MNTFHDERQRSLKRLLANGPLTAVPKRPPDQELIAMLAAARFDPERTYSESEVNETLKAWLETFCEPEGIDHVTLRRMMVDSRLLVRTKSGSTYRVSLARRDHEEAAGIDPAEVLAEIRKERQTRKRAARGSGTE